MGDRPGQPTIVGYCLAAIVLSIATAQSTPQRNHFDFVFRNGVVIDGTGAPGRKADVAIRDGVIAAVGTLDSASANREIDIAGLHVAPGFIDLHSHADEGLSDPARAGAINFLTQGVTSAVVGQDGASAWPGDSTLAEQAARWRSVKIGLNVFPLVGHWSVRREVMNEGGCKPAESSQLTMMARRVENALRAGAWGLSTGVEFMPCATLHELVAVTRPVGRLDAVHISHIRDESGGVLGAMTELMLVAALAEARTVVSHIKASGRDNWGKASAMIEILDVARSAGLDVYADLYPYTASGSGYDVQLVPALDAIPLPDDYRGERPRQLNGWLADAELVGALLQAVEQTINERGGPSDIVISRHDDQRFIDRTLAQIAKERETEIARVALELVAEGAGFMHRQMSEDDIAAFIQQPYVAASSDGWIPKSVQTPHHPRSYGAFTLRLRRYVRELEVVTLPFAIRAATGLPAEILGLKDRGLVKNGYAADLVVFDASRIGDRATYGRPHQHSEGILWVLVNGRVAIENGVPNGVRAGRVLLKKDP